MAGVDTGVASVSTLMKNFYDKLFLERLTPQLRYDQFAVKKNIPLHEGKTVIWNRLTNFASGYPLTELSVPGLSAMSAAKVSATVVEFGYLVGISDFFDMTSISQPVKDAVGLLQDGAKLTVDNYYGDQIGFGSCASTGISGTYASTAIPSCKTQGFPLLYNRTLSWTQFTLYNVSSPTLSAMNVDRIDLAVTQLQEMNVPPMDDGYYVGVIHPTIASKLRRDTNWITWNQYLQSKEAGYKGEIGQVAGVRFVQSTNAIKTPVSAADWSAYASNFSAGGTLYGTLIFGKGAYGGVDMENGDASKITVVDFKADKADPLGQYGTAGYKIKIAAKILNPSAGVLMVDYISN
jgi:N4-gp56 family major capsid protein